MCRGYGGVCEYMCVYVHSAKNTRNKKIYTHAHSVRLESFIWLVYVCVIYHMCAQYMLCTRLIYANYYAFMAWYGAFICFRLATCAISDSATCKNDQRKIKRALNYNTKFDKLSKILWLFSFNLDKPRNVWSLPHVSEHFSRYLNIFLYIYIFL